MKTNSLFHGCLKLLNCTVYCNHDKQKFVFIILQHIKAIINSDSLVLMESDHPAIQEFIPELEVRYHGSLSLSLSSLSLVPRPLPDFISQLRRKIGRRPGIKTLQNYVTDRKWWTWLVCNVDSVCPSPPFPVRDVVLIPGLLPIFLHGYKIKSGSGLGTRLFVLKLNKL